MVMYCVWLSVDPARRKIDYYPKNIALRIEKSYSERDQWTPCSCVLGTDFFNSTIHFHPNGSTYQTTPGMSLGRAGFKQPGYRSVKRVILNDTDRRIKIFSKQIHSEWRICSEFYSDISFDELVPEECKIEINDETIEIEKIETWKPEDLDSGSLDTNIIVWQWCKGTFENQGNLFRLSNDWFIPYNYQINNEIENAFNSNDSVIIELPLIGERRIEFINGTCFAKQLSLDGRYLRFMRRIVTTIQEIKLMFDRISIPPQLNIDDILSKLPDGEIPHHFNCPILQDIMKDPVKTVDGHIYDRASIQRWFTHNTTSPLTGLRLQSTVLEPQLELKKQIDDFLTSLLNEKNQNATTSQVLIKDNNLESDNDSDDDF